MEDDTNRSQPRDRGRTARFLLYIPETPPMRLSALMFSYLIRPRTALAGLLLAASPVLAGCGNEHNAAAAPEPPTVTVATPVQRTIVDQDDYVGRFIAVDSVEVRARVSGYLDKVHFKDGQMVKEGDLLFTIDKRPFQNTLDQARANLETAKSNLTYAQADMERGRQLVRDKTITDQVFQQRAQAFRNAQASVAANEAMVRQAELDLSFTELRAPIAGRIGDRRVTQGNLVTGGTGGNTTLLATIVSTDPIHFEFTFDETSLLRYQRLASQGTEHINSTPVRLKLIDEPEYSHIGRMDFIDNVIDRSTGTIRARAKFANADGLFVPGMFAHIEVPASAPYRALMVPEAAIGTEQVQKFVYVIGKDNIAKQVYVTLGQVVDGLRVIKNGLHPNDRVVVKGLMRVHPGVKVNPELQGASPTGSQARTD
jgi:RND family efflux transporter MFP subunit